MQFKENSNGEVDLECIENYVPVHIREKIALKLKQESEKVSLSIDPLVQQIIPTKFVDAANIKQSRLGPYIE